MCDFVSRNKKLFEELNIFINSIKKEENNLMDVLHYAQSIFGYLPKDVSLILNEYS